MSADDALNLPSPDDNVELQLRRDETGRRRVTLVASLSYTDARIVRRLAERLRDAADALEGDAPMTSSRRKDATGERELSVAIHEATGVKLVRQLDQYQGGGYDLAPKASDDTTIAERLRRHAIERKRQRTATAGEIAERWAQAVRQVDDTGLDAVLADRTDRQSWRVVVALDALKSGLSAAGGTVTLSLDGFAALALPPDQFSRTP